MKYVQHIILFALGLLIGGGMCRTCTDHFRGGATSETDTIYVHDTVRYSRLELVTNRHRLNIPKIGTKDYVYIPSDSVTTIYRDNIQYVTLPRQFFHTKTQDAEIWHSGIDSTIDSLAVFRNDMVISKTETTTQAVRKRHSLSLGIEASYMTTAAFPVQLEYAYHLTRWLDVYGYAEYELLRKQVGIGIGTNIIFEW